MFASSQALPNGFGRSLDHVATVAKRFRNHSLEDLPSGGVSGGWCHGLKIPRGEDFLGGGPVSCAIDHPRRCEVTEAETAVVVELDDTRGGQI